MNELFIDANHVVRQRLADDPRREDLRVFNFDGELFFGASPEFESLLEQVEQECCDKTRIVILRLKYVRNPDGVCIKLLDQFLRKMECAASKSCLAEYVPAWPTACETPASPSVSAPTASSWNSRKSGPARYAPSPLPRKSLRRFIDSSRRLVENLIQRRRHAKLTGDTTQVLEIDRSEIGSNQGRRIGAIDDSAGKQLEKDQVFACQCLQFKSQRVGCYGNATAQRRFGEV